MTFHLTSDAQAPGGATSTVASADFIRSWVYRLRLDYMFDPIVRLPLIGPGSSMIAHIESDLALADARKTGGTTIRSIDDIRNFIADLAGACFTITDRLKHNSNRALERLAAAEIANIVGFAEDTPEGQLIYEALAAINQTESKIASPAMATRLVPLLMEAATLESPGFNGTALSPASRQLITARMVGRLITSLAQIPLSPTLGPRQGVERTQAVIDVLSSYGVLLSSVAFAESLAAVEAQVAFLTSPIVSDLLTEANLIQQREEILRDMADVRPLVGVNFGAVFSAFYAPRNVKSGSNTSELLLLPSDVIASFERFIAPKQDTLPGLPAGQDSVRAALTGYAVNDPFDQSKGPKGEDTSRATRSKLFGFAVFKDRKSRLQVLDALRKHVAQAIAGAMSSLKEIRNDWLYGMARRYSSSAGATLPRYGTQFAMFDMGGLTPTDPADDAPVVTATTEADATIDKDVGYLHSRPLVPAVIEAEEARDFSPLALLYSPGLIDRLASLAIKTGFYVKDAGTTLAGNTPIVNFLLPVNPLYTKATALSAPEAWQLWPRCWLDFVAPPARTLSLTEMTSIIPKSADDRALQIIREIERVAAAEQYELLATAFAHIGAVLHTSDDAYRATGDRGVSKLGAVLFSLLNGKAGKDVDLIGPKHGFKLMFDAGATLRPTTWKGFGLQGLKLMQYASAEEVTHALARLSPNGDVWFLPFTHQFSPTPFDDVSFKVAQDYTSTRLIEMEAYTLTSPLLAAEQSADFVSEEADLVRKTQKSKARVITAADVATAKLRGANLLGSGSRTSLDVKERAPHFHSNGHMGNLLKMGGFTLVANHDIRAYHPVSVAAAINAAPAVRYFLRRAAGSWPSPIARSMVGSLLITLPTPDKTSALSFSSTREKDNLPTAPSDWLTLRIKPDVHPSSIL